jgi:hypothetical protein
MKRLFFLVMLFSVISLAINFASECMASIDDNIVLWLKFDEGKGTIASDSSNYKNDGTITGAKWVDGKKGSALSFAAGASNLVEIPSNDSLQLSDKGLTIAVWFKTTETAGSDLMFIEKGAWDTGEYALSYPGCYFWKVRFQINEICELTADCQVDSVTGTPDLSDNKWHHTAGVYDAINHKFKIYVDGKLETEEAAAAHKFTPDNQSVFLGCRNKAGNWYVGAIDDLLVAKIPFTDDQIKKHMDGTLAAVAPTGKLSTEWGMIKY